MEFILSPRSSMSALSDSEQVAATPSSSVVEGLHCDRPGTSGLEPQEGDAGDRPGQSTASQSTEIPIAEPDKSSSSIASSVSVPDSLTIPEKLVCFANSRQLYFGKILLLVAPSIFFIYSPVVLNLTLILRRACLS